MADIGKIKANIVTMGSNGATDDDILAYIASENVTEEELRASPIQPRGAALDVAVQAPVGALQGAIAYGTAGLPGSLIQGAEWAGRKLGKGINYLGEKVNLLPEGYAQQNEQEYLKGMEQMYPGFEAGTKTLMGLPTGQYFQEKTDPYLPKPHTEAGRRARIAGEIVGSAVVPVGGAASTAYRAGEGVMGATKAAGRSALAYGVTPAATSELGGNIGNLIAPGSQEGEQYGRAIGALVGGGIGAYASGPSRSQRMMTAGLKNASPQDMAKAKVLMDDARTRFGIDITPSEALGYVTKGRSDLSEVQRIIERVQPGAEIMAPFMQRRTDAVGPAIERLKGNISPTAGKQSEIGYQAGKIAESAIEGERKAINQATRGLYDSGEMANIPRNKAFFDMFSDKLFADVFRKMKADPKFSAGIEKAPANNIRVLDAVRRKARDMAAIEGREGGALGAASYNRVIGMVDKAIDDAITSAQGASVRTNTPMPLNAQRLLDYRKALSEQSAARQGVLMPLERSIVGDLARATDNKSGVQASTAAGKAIQPKTIAEGQQVGIADALSRVRAENPEVAKQLVRSVVDQRQQRYVAELISGENQYGGAKFAASLAGSPQKMKNFSVAIEAVTNGATADEARRLIEVLKATGYRRRAGSDTAFNTELQNALKTPEGIRGIAAFLQPVSSIRTGIENIQFNKNARQIAEALTSPNGLDLLSSIGAEGRNVVGRALRNFLLSQSANEPITEKSGLQVDVYPNMSPPQPGLLGQ